jgi:hypothetical protein
MKLVTLTEAKYQLMMDHDQDDPYIELLIQGASAAVVEYLKSGATFLNSSGEVPVDSSGDPEGVPFQVKAATLILIAEWYKNREAEQDGAVDAQFGYGYLPRPVTALLYPLRDPALA